MANNSTRDILQRMSDHLEDLEGLDYEKTQPLPDDVTDLNTFVTPGIYCVEHPENVEHGPGQFNGDFFSGCPYILVVTSKLDSAPTWFTQYASIGNHIFTRNQYAKNGKVGPFVGSNWIKLVYSDKLERCLTYPDGIHAVTRTTPIVYIDAPNQYFVPGFVVAYTPDNSHCALWMVLNNINGSGSNKWFINPILSDSDIQLTCNNDTSLALTASSSLLEDYNMILYTYIKSVA